MSIFALIIFPLVCLKCLIIKVIIININGVPIYLGQHAPYQLAEQHHCWVLGPCSILALSIPAIELSGCIYWCQGILMVYLNNVIHASTCLLLWWWYDDVIVCWVFICMQKCLKVSDVKFVPTCQTIFFGSPHSAKISLVICTRISVEGLFTFFFTIGNLLW